MTCLRSLPTKTEDEENNYMILKSNDMKVQILPNPPETLLLIARRGHLNAAGKGGRVRPSGRQRLAAPQHRAGRAAVPGEPRLCRRAGRSASCFPGPWNLLTGGRLLCGPPHPSSGPSTFKNLFCFKRKQKSKGKTTGICFLLAVKTK